MKDLRRAGDPTAILTGRIKAGVAWLLGLFGLGGGATAVTDAGGDGSSVLEKASDALSLWERLQLTAAPLTDVFGLAIHWLWVPAIAALVLAWLLSRHCERQRLEAYKCARML